MDTLIKRLHTSDKKKREEAFQEIRKLGTPGADILISMLHNASDEDRCDAAWVLLDLNSQAYLDILLQLLKDSSETVRWFLCGALRNVNDDRCIAPLLDIILYDPSAGVRYLACETIMVIGDYRAIPTLTIVSENDNGQDYEGRTVKEMALWAIDEIKKRSFN